MDHSTLRRLLAVAAAAALTACSSGDSTEPAGNGDGGGNQTPAISLQLSSTSINLVAGASGAEADLSAVQDAGVTLTATITRSGGFTGSVNIAVSGAPTGVTATPSPSTISGDATTSTIDVTAASNAAAGNSTLTVTASGTGVTSVTATFQVAVTVPSPGTFSLAVTPTSVSVEQGQETTATVNITRGGGFTGSVDLAATAPAGLTVTLNPASTTAASSTLTVTASGSVAAGAYTVAITGNATAIGQQATSLGVTVTAASTGGSDVTFSYCADQVPTWFAYQDGSGAWTRVNPVGSTFTFPVSSGRGGVATVNASTATLEIFYGVATELNALGVRCDPSSNGPTKTVMGTVSGLGASDQANVSLGSARTIVTPAAGTSFTLNGVRDGAQDLLATRTTLSIQGQTSSTQLVSMIIRRGLNPANGTTLPDLNLAGPESFAPVQRNLTINNIGSETSIVGAAFLTTGNVAGQLYTDAAMLTGSARQYYGVPNANRISGDLHVLTVSAFSGTTFTSFRSVSSYFAEAVDRTVTLGPPISGVNVSTAATSPYARLRATYTAQPEYDDYVFFTGYQLTGNRTFTIFASKAYMNGAATFDVAIPDFSGTADWMNTWAPQSGAATNWQFGGSGLTGQSVLTAPFTDGGGSLTAVVTGTITP